MGGPVAQSGRLEKDLKYRAFNPRVPGSTPGGPAFLIVVNILCNNSTKSG